MADFPTESPPDTPDEIDFVPETIEQQLIAAKGSRVTVRKSNAGLRFEIRVRRGCLYLSSMFMIFGFMSLIGSALLFTPWTAGDLSRGIPALVFFMLFWIASGYFFMWGAFGKEVIELSPLGLSVRKGVFGWGRTRTADLSRIKNFTVLPWGTPAGLGLGGPIMIETREGKIYLGSGLHDRQVGIVSSVIKDWARIQVARSASMKIH